MYSHKTLFLTLFNKFIQISNSTDVILLFALKHYDNPQCEGEKEFYDDMKRFKYIKRLLKKYKSDGIVKERLLLNHIIILNNVFGPDAASTLLLFKIEPEHWPQLKSFLVFLNMLPDGELKEINEDEKISEVLKEL